MLNNRIPDYLKLKCPDFELNNVRGKITFTCPFPHRYVSKFPTAELKQVDGISKFYCVQCGNRKSIFDIVRFLEQDKHNWSDAQITEYLIPLLNSDLYKDFNIYKTLNWSLVPLARNSKKPIEADWTDITHFEKLDWIKWSNNGLNLGLRTGQVSGITVIDIDNKHLEVLTEEQNNIRTELIGELEKLQTLKQNTPSGGCHYLIAYDERPKTTVNLGGLQIDIRNDGAQIAIAPSVFDKIPYKFESFDVGIKPASEKIILNLLELNKVGKGRNLENSLILTPENSGLSGPLKLKSNNLTGCCNDTFVRLGGIFSKQLTMEQTRMVLSVFNRQLLETPMEQRAIDSMVCSLEEYRKDDSATVEDAIWKYCSQMEKDIIADDIVKSIFNNDKNKHNIVYKYLSKFVLDGKMVREGRGRYRTKKMVEWSDQPPEMITEYPYKIPYLNDIALFQHSDLIIIGAQPTTGKSTMAMNIIGQMVAQGVKPYLLYNEAGSRFNKTAERLGIEDKYYHFCHPNPIGIELEEEAFTVIDWLNLGQEGFEKTANVLGHLNKEIEKKKGILIVFTQLKKDNDFFAPNLITQFPSYAIKFIRDSEDGTESHLDCVKIREPKGNYTTYRINLVFSHDTRIIKLKETI